MSDTNHNLGNVFNPLLNQKERAEIFKQSKYIDIKNPDKIYVIDGASCQLTDNLQFGHLYFDKESLSDIYLYGVKKYFPTGNNRIDGLNVLNIRVEWGDDYSQVLKYLYMHIGFMEVRPSCPINQQILSMITNCDIYFSVEEHEGILKPFYSIELLEGTFFCTLKLVSGSLDFKKDFMFLSSILQILHNQGYQSISLQDMYDMPLEHVELMKMTKY